MQIDWYDAEHSLILWTMVGEWQAADFATASDKVADLMKSCDYPVDMILDTLNAGAMPRDAIKLTSRFMKPSFPKNCRAQIIVTNNKLMQGIIKLSESLAPATSILKTTQNMDEALVELKKLREKAK